MEITNNGTRLKLFLFRMVRVIFGAVASDQVRYCWINFRLIRRFRWPNIKNPLTFNEKILWLKSNHKFSLGTVFADKIQVRDYVKSKIGEDILIPILKIYSSHEEIDLGVLPERYVIKTNHGSGNVEIVFGHTKSEVIKKFNKVRGSLAINYYRYGGEWQYNYIKPIMFIEEFLGGSEKSEISDYKVLCFNGVPRLIQVDIDRFTNHTRNFYDTSWNKLDFSIIYPISTMQVERPRDLKVMLHYARLLSGHLPFMRVDFYVVDEKIYFGELTLHQEGGVGPFSDEGWNNKLGDWIDLP